jgi:putative inorganic carbon (HCO3(-)) transporter
MLRTMFVLGLMSVGTYYALQGPFYAVLFYLWNAYFRPEEWLWLDALKGAKLSLIIGSYLLLVTLCSGRTFPRHGRVLLIGLFLVQSLLSTVFSPHSAYSWPYWIEFAKINMIGYLMLVLIDDFTKFRAVLLVIALSLGVEGAKQGWFYLLTSPGGVNTNPIPFLGDNNGVAVGMLMLVPIFTLLAQTTPRKWARWCYGFLLMGVLYRALSTYSRGGFLAACVLGSLCWLHSRRKLRALVVLLVLLIIVVPNLPDAFWVRMQTIQTYAEDQDHSALGRLHFWQVALLMAAEHPILGVGFNAYNVAYNHYDFFQGTYGGSRSVHSSFFGVIAELGYGGFALFALILLAAFRSCQRASNIGWAHPELAHLRSAATALRLSLVVFLIGGSFLAVQYQEMLWHYIFLAFVLDGLALRATMEPPKVRARNTGGSGALQRA